uniref:Uncharacterized protein n=1 Tax=Mycena chlorophos TaxID=658473 RepID=A0ABQ0LAY7_MYCCL|nr:predicted protein [Mycena chlorophos]
MARPKKPEGKLPKQNIPLYDEATVPASMPFPLLKTVVFSKAQEIPVPQLSECQRSWVQHEGIGDRDLVSLDRKTGPPVYEDIKARALDSKAFKHVAQPDDATEEGALAALVAAWKAKEASKTTRRGKSKQLYAASSKDDDDSDDGDDGDAEVDAITRGTLLRGYPIAGWNYAIQTMISNKRTATANKTKRTQPVSDDATVAAGEQPALSAVLAKLFGLAAYTGREKWADEHYDEIYAYSQTLSHNMNAGARFCKAKADLWAKENQAVWEAAAVSTDGVDWSERQGLVGGALKHMVETLNSTGKFRPFFALSLMGWLDVDGRLRFEWSEGKPDGVVFDQAFEAKHSALIKTLVDSAYGWGEQPFKDAYHPAKRSSGLPTLTLTRANLGDFTPKSLSETITGFVGESFNAAFGTTTIPWADICERPGEYYDNTHHTLPFRPDGLETLSPAAWFELGTQLLLITDSGTKPLFQPGSITLPSKSATPPPKSPTPPPKSPTLPPKSPPPPPPRPESLPPPPRRKPRTAQVPVPALTGSPQGHRLRNRNTAKEPPKERVEKRKRGDDDDAGRKSKKGKKQ